MNQRSFSITCVVFCCLFFLCGSARAEVEWAELFDFSLPDKPLDIAASKDGHLVFVLTKGAILQFDPKTNSITGRIPVGPKFNQLLLLDEVNTLIVSSSADQSLKFISFEPIYAINMAHSPVIGPNDAPVTITVFSDYQCPYCSKLDEMLHDVLKNNPETVKLVIKHYPLQNHQYAFKAAMAALAAARQDKFARFHADLLTNFRALNDQKVLDIATQLELDLEQFKKDIQDQELAKLIQQDMNDAIDMQIRAVPTIFINGKQLKNRDPEAIQKIIDAIVEKNKPAKK